MAASRSQSNIDIDDLIGETRPRPRSVKPPTKPHKKPLLISFREWAGSQVSAYRVGLMLGYLAIVYFGASAYLAGIPTFKFTTPEGWTPIWASTVVLGGVIAAVGSLKAGTEPITREVVIYNRVELTGAILLFLTLGTYAALLLILGYGYGDAGRSSIGAGFVALGIHPTVRMVWLIFRPRFMQKNHNVHLIQVGAMLTIPKGYTIAKLDDEGNIIPETPEQKAARLAVATSASDVPLTLPSRVELGDGTDVD